MKTAFARSIRQIEGEALVVLTLEINENGKVSTERLTLPIDYCIENRIKKGPVDENTLEGLYSEAKLCHAVRRGEAILAYSANSKAALVKKLRRRGIDGENAKNAAEILDERGFINDRENALGEAERCLKKLWGARRILAQLSAKGYSDAALEEVRDFLSDVDFAPSLRTLINKKYPNALSADRHEREKAVAALIRYGYPISLIRAVVSKMGGEDIEEY